MFVSGHGEHPGLCVAAVEVPPRLLDAEAALLLACCAAAAALRFLDGCVALLDDCAA
jgi:hypothetical protein